MIRSCLTALQSRVHQQTSLAAQTQKTFWANRKRLSAPRPPTPEHLDVVTSVVEITLSHPRLCGSPAHLLRRSTDRPFGWLISPLNVDANVDELDGAVMSAFIRARKPSE